MAKPVLNNRQLAVAIGLLGDLSQGISTEQDANLSRLSAAAVATIELFAPTAPQDVANEAQVRLVAYWFDTDPASNPRQSGYGNAMVSSGAASLLGPWRQQVLAVPSGQPSLGGAGSRSTTAELTNLTARVAALEAREAGEVRAARQVPQIEPRHIGNVLAAGSNLKSFWDTALDILLRALGPLAGQGGKYLRIGGDETSIDLVDAPTQSGQSANVDQTARNTANSAATAAAAAAKQSGENAEAVVALSHAVDDAQREIDAIVDAHHANFVDVPANNRAIEAGVSPDGIVQGDAHHSLYVVPASAVADTLSFTADADTLVVPTIVLPIGLEVGGIRVVHKRGNAVHGAYPADGQHYARFATDYDYGLAYYRLQSDLNDNPVKVGARLGDIFQTQQATETVSLKDGIVDADALETQVAQRLLPPGGDNGQYVARIQGAPAWVDGPGGVAGGAGGLTGSDDSNAQLGVQGEDVTGNDTTYRFLLGVVSGLIPGAMYRVSGKVGQTQQAVGTAASALGNAAVSLGHPADGDNPQERQPGLLTGSWVPTGRDAQDNVIVSGRAGFDFQGNGIAGPAGKLSVYLYMQASKSGRDEPPAINIESFEAEALFVPALTYIIKAQVKTTFKEAEQIRNGHPVKLADSNRVEKVDGADSFDDVIGVAVRGGFNGELAYVIKSGFVYQVKIANERVNTRNRPSLRSLKIGDRIYYRNTGVSGGMQQGARWSNLPLNLDGDESKVANPASVAGSVNAHSGTVPFGPILANNFADVLFNLDGTAATVVQPAAPSTPVTPSAAILDLGFQNQPANGDGNSSSFRRFTPPAGTSLFILGIGDSIYPMTLTPGVGSPRHVGGTVWTWDNSTKSFHATNSSWQNSTKVFAYFYGKGA